MSWQAFPLSLLLAGTAWGVMDRTIATPNPIFAQTSTPATPSSQKIFYVNPSTGNDTGPGEAQAPFKTITRALEVAPANSVIQLAEGTYSNDSGEVFPLKLKPNVTLIGNPQTKGQNIRIVGGGGFISRTFAGQNITLLAADRSTISGITLTNPNFRGFGLWVESSSPTIEQSTFTGTSQDGVFVTGNSNPLIRQNYFVQNSGIGLSIHGTSSPQVQENIFQNTGYGINLGGNATPRIVSNRFTGNRSGIVTTENARPILRNNVIENNTQFGVVAISQARPDLGTSQEAGGNIFQGNRELDINAKATTQTIPAFGNQLSNRTQGKIDLQGVTAALEVVETMPRPVPLSARNTPVQGENSPSVRSPASLPPGPNNNPPLRSFEFGATNPTPAPNNNPPLRSFEFGATNPPASPPSQNLGSRRTLPSLSGNPSPNLPNLNANTGGNLVPSRRYRVIVEAATASQQARVRSIVPDAFRTTYQARPAMQAGIFSDRDKADQMVQFLTQSGFTARVEDLR